MNLPEWGRVHIDRQLPFLCLYRRPRRRDDVGTERLVSGEAAYVLAAGNPRLHKGLADLIRAVAATLAPMFGSFLIVEVWSTPDPPREDAEPQDVAAVRPRFVIHAPRSRELASTVEALRLALGPIVLRRAARRRHRAEVEVAYGGKTTPPGSGPVLARAWAQDLGCHAIGIEVKPVYRETATGRLFPLVLRRLERELARAMRRGLFEFSRSQTSHFPPHYQALGPRAMTRTVWDVDRCLADVGDAFDFLLTVTPVNTDRAWSEFKRRKCERAPVFDYRPLPVEPELLKRELFAIPIERIDDAAVAQLFWDKQMELDRQITMLLERQTRRFLYGSLLVYGDVDGKILRLARDVIERTPARSREGAGHDRVGAKAFAERAWAEIARYRKVYPALKAGVEIRGDISGLLVVRGKLLVGAHIQVPAARVDALIQHEVGTHLLTYVNGLAQPFKQLHCGLAGYDELQEGLAVLAEYIAGGLSRARLRVIAGRVIAVDSLTDGASFVETFRELHRNCGFSEHAAFGITTRVYRGGGLTKDAAYLKGLAKLLKYIANDGAIDPLFVGKFSLDHVPLIEELLWRRVLSDPLLRPRFLARPESAARLEGLRGGLTVLDLLD